MRSALRPATGVLRKGDAGTATGLRSTDLAAQAHFSRCRTFMSSAISDTLTIPPGCDPALSQQSLAFLNGVLLRPIVHQGLDRRHDFQTSLPRSQSGDRPRIAAFASPRRSPSIADRSPRKSAPRHRPLRRCSRRKQWVPVSRSGRRPADKKQWQEVDQRRRADIEQRHVDPLCQTIQSAQAQRGNNGAACIDGRMHVENRRANDRRRAFCRSGGVGDARDRLHQSLRQSRAGERTVMTRCGDIADNRMRRRLMPQREVFRIGIARQQNNIGCPQRRRVRPL